MLSFNFVEVPFTTRLTKSIFIRQLYNEEALVKLRTRSYKYCVVLCLFYDSRQDNMKTISFTYLTICMKIVFLYIDSLEYAF
jgi:hypothetical protein